MNSGVIVLILCAALLHASWNAILRRPGDRLRSVTAMSAATAVTALPFAFFLPLPAGPSWIYLGASAALQVFYSWFLILAYGLADLGQVYPITRGAIPLFATLGAALFAGQIPTAWSIAGVAVISLGTVTFAMGKGRIHGLALVLALSTSLTVACYNVVDGIGVRLAGNPYAYAIWIFLLYGLFMPIVFTIVKHRRSEPAHPWPIGPSIAAGLIQFITYGIVIWAYSLAPVGPVVALRETSIVFALLIGRIFLSEALSVQRVVAALLIVIGAVALAYR